MRVAFQLLSAVLFLASNVFGQETAGVCMPKISDSDGVRLGISISKPDSDSIAHLPGLPPGIGFVVTDVEKDGPAELGGLKKLDLLWKMEGQMLVNQGQLATLLRLEKPGEKVTLSVFRLGKALDLEVELGDGKNEKLEISWRELNDSVVREGGETVRIVDQRERKAVFSGKNGTVEVYRVEDGDAVKIANPEGELIFEGVVRGRPELSMVPDEWRRQVCALRRGLFHATNAEEEGRTPRPRIVAPPAVAEGKGE